MTRNLDPDDQATQDLYDTGATGQNTLLRADYLRYPDLRDHSFDSIQMYWGAGPMLSFYRDHQEREFDGSLTVMRQWGGGMEGVVGVEWFVRPRISLMAEYGASVEYDRIYMRSRRTFGVAMPEDQKSTGYQLDARTNSVRFDISAYVRRGE